MNIALEDTQEVVEGIKRANYGDSFIRGNNGELNLFSRDALADYDSFAVLYITAKE